MTDTELIAYFENATLPEMLRVDRATKQYELPRYAKQHIDLLKQNPDDKNARFWLLRIKKALDKPFSGQEVPRF
ncbi:hypothetical protein BDD43_4802 [Mucilaginibacter gracilis]|uniref:DUF6965 domain-containing protein n=1 Tax=Mucilaginibacter gracilis TaxID=423350 RepID=A0A495J928_9SPHI|nr:hypothetical protein [Mucilaginibacter gracilis]RKR84559.1 hypothetical protein BDD43_4802 [Mucilaginibacter gracilis]